MNIHIPPALKELLPAELAETCQAKIFHKNQVIFKTGGIPKHMFFITSGEAALTRPSIHGEPTILQRVSQGFISEASLLTDKYHCDSHFTKEGIAITIPVDHMRSALVDPEFSKKWTLLLSREIMRLRTRAERLSLKDIKSKIIHLIETEGKGGLLTISSDYKTLAAEIGVTHEALYRTIASMESMGFIKKSAQSIELLHPRKPS